MVHDCSTCTAAIAKVQQRYEAVSARYDRQCALLAGLYDRRQQSGVCQEAAFELQLLASIGGLAAELQPLALELGCWYERLQAVQPAEINEASIRLWRSVAEAMRGAALDAYLQRLTLVQAACRDSSELEYAYCDIARLGDVTHREIALLAILGIRQRRFGALSEAAGHAHWLLMGFYGSQGQPAVAELHRGREEKIRSRHRVG